MSGLGPVDGFDQDHAAGKSDKGGVVLCGFLASQGDALKALEFAECLLDPRAAFIEYFGEEGRLVLGIRTVRDDRADASLTRRLAISRRIVALIGHRRPRHYIGTSFEQRLEILAIAGLSAGEMETDGMTVLVCF